MRARNPDPGLTAGASPVPGKEAEATQTHAAVLRDLLAASDPDRLARHLGLRSAAAAERLIGQDAACRRLAERMAEGCNGLTVDEATDLCLQLVGQRP